MQDNHNIDFTHSDKASDERREARKAMALGIIAMITSPIWWIVVGLMVDTTLGFGFTVIQFVMGLATLIWGKVVFWAASKD